jgi:hypothetical protein
MTALSTLEGQPLGADLAIVSGGKVQHWTVAEGGGLVRDGQRLDPWFLTGLLAQGMVVSGQFAPPEPGEWFAVGRYRYLVLDRDQRMSQIAVFRMEPFRFYRFDKTSDLQDTASRCPEPAELSAANFMAMTTYAWSQHRQVQELSAKAGRLDQVASSLAQIKYYLERAERAVTS